jgi:hypothetical protein
MVRVTGMASEDSSPVGEGPGGRTVEPLSSGGTQGRPDSIGDVDELLTTGKSRTTNRPRDPKVTLPEDTSTMDESAQPQCTHNKKVWSYMATKKV